ncbi:MAG: hypothetical protein ACRC8S_07275 [Fimbriiglobus sp.]
MTTDLPVRVMNDVCWSFIGSVTASFDDFNERVRRYQIRIREQDSWRPNAIVIPCTRVAVRYMCWQADEQIEPIVILEADDSSGFSAGEFLFKLHNMVVEQLREIDHHFFEGLTLAGWLEEGRVPLYHLRQGS